MENRRRMNISSKVHNAHAFELGASLKKKPYLFKQQSDEELLIYGSNITENPPKHKKVTCFSSTYESQLSSKHS